MRLARSLLMGPEHKSATLPADPTNFDSLISWYLHNSELAGIVILDDTIQLLACSSKIQTTTITQSSAYVISIILEGVCFRPRNGGSEVLPFHHSNTHTSVMETEAS